MILAQFAEPVPGQEPADALRTLAFMANFAAQTIAGHADASRGVDELIDALAHPAPNSRTYLFAAANDEILGPLSQLGFPEISSTGTDAEPEVLGWLSATIHTRDNTWSMDVSIELDVDLLEPCSPGEETVRFLLSQAQQIAQSLGRSHLQLWLPHALDADHPYLDQVRSLGFVRALDSTEYVIPLTNDRASDRVVAFANEDFPESLVASVAELYNRASIDQPHGLLKVEPNSWSAASLAEATAHFRSLGTQNYHTLALDQGGAVIGLSEVWIHAGFSPEVAIQGLTYVLPEHRRQGLGLELKRSVMATAADAHPQLRRVYTSVADANAPMIELNRRLGATPVNAVSGWVMKLEDV